MNKSEQWTLEGNCEICRRNNYCNNACKKAKSRSQREMRQAFYSTFARGGSTSWKCAEAGNDLIMPGFPGDIESIKGALADGSLSREALKACVRRMLTVIFQTLAFEDCVAYAHQFQ